MNTVEQGQEAWGRIKHNNKLFWPDWVLIGRALEIGREACMKIAETNTPFGKRYTKAMAAWLRETGLDEIPNQVRWRLSMCMKNLGQIEPWLASLDDDRRSRMSHPDTIWMNFEKSQLTRSAPKNKKASPQNRVRRASKYGGHTARTSSDMIREIAGLIRKHWSGGDTFVAAVKVLDALLAPPHRDELLNLLLDADATPKAVANEVTHGLHV